MGLISWIKKQISGETLKKRKNSKSTSTETYINPRQKMKNSEIRPKISVPRMNRKIMQPLKEGLLPGEIILLDWSNNKSEYAHIPAYFEYNYGLNATTARNRLIRLGYLEIASFSKSLNSLLVPDLKDILRKNGKKVSGKKVDLIHRISEGLEENVYSEYIPNRPLVCTPAGSELLEKYSNLVWVHKHNSTDGTINIETALTHSIEDMQSKHDYSSSIEAQTQNMLSDLKELGTSSYEILGSLDKSTCEKCGRLDGKIFQLSHVKPGINFPPFHEGCRCTVVPHLTGLPETGKRIAKDPQTGKNEFIPNKNYSEWRETMIKKYGTDVFK